MRIDDFFQIDLAVHFHDNLNPRLFDQDQQMHPEVRHALLNIAKHFQNFLGVEDLDLVDITVSGSNAAYTYTPHSDLDLHLVVMSGTDNHDHDAHMRQLFDAKKYQYNDQHEIRVRDIDVELYVQDADQPHVSAGVYSVMKNKWIRLPRRRRADIDDYAVKNKFQNMRGRINQAILSDDIDRVQAVWDDVKNMRKTGLTREGEFSPENLAFKILRAQGMIEKLKNHVLSITSSDLSIDEDGEFGDSNPMLDNEEYIDEGQYATTVNKNDPLASYDLISERTLGGFRVTPLDVQSTELDEIDRRGFLKAMGGAALAGATGMAAAGDLERSIGPLPIMATIKVQMPDGTVKVKKIDLGHEYDYRLDDAKKEIEQILDRKGVRNYTIHLDRYNDNSAYLDRDTNKNTSKNDYVDNKPSTPGPAGKDRNYMDNKPYKPSGNKNYMDPAVQNEALKLDAPQKKLDRDELHGYVDRIKSGTKTKADKFKPIIHGSNIKAITQSDNPDDKWDLDDLAQQIMQRPTKILGTNAKMAKSKEEGAMTYDLTLPALSGIVVDEETGDFVQIETCPGAGECQLYCYARKGGYVMFPDSSMSAARALNFLVNDPEGYMSMFDREVKQALARTTKAGIKLLVRIHDAGDFFSKEYYDLAMKVADNNPDAKFYFYTKMGDLAQDPGAPSNVIGQFSTGAQGREVKKVQFQRDAGQHVKDAITLPKDMFRDLFQTDKKGKYVKDEKGRSVVKGDAEWNQFKQELAAKYKLDPDTIITYDQMLKIPEGPKPKWNVIVFPAGHGDLGASRLDVSRQFLMFH